MTASPPSSSQRQIFASLIFSLGALFLLVNLVGVARLAYDVVVRGAPGNLLVKVLILVVVLVVGLALGAASHRRFGSDAFLLFTRVFAWVYLALASLTYLGITLRLSLHDYSIVLYGAFLFLILVELGTVVALRLFVPGRAIGLFAIPLLMIVLFHLAVIVYEYIFASQPISGYLAGDLLFLLAMTILSTALLGENAFRSLIERVIERVG